ncbi:MAG: response regulator [Anaerolineae bacterium]
MPSIVVIDDDPQTCDLLRIMLEPMGLKVYTAPGSNEGFHLVQQVQPEIVLVDLLLPLGLGVDGWQFIATIKSNADLRHIRALAITAVHSPDSKRRAFEAGCDDFIPKPFQLSDLRKKVQKFLS